MYIYYTGMVIMFSEISVVEVKIGKQKNFKSYEKPC